MSKNTKITSLDANQYSRREHDEENDAKRVFLVGGDPIIIKQTEYKTIEVPVVIKEIEKQDNLFIKLGLIMQLISIIELFVLLIRR